MQGEEQDRSTNLNSMGGTKFKNKLWLKLEILLVSGLIIGVWIILSLPFIFYQLPTSEVRVSVALYLKVKWLNVFYLLFMAGHALILD